MTDLNRIIFKLDIYGSVNSFRQNLQAAYTKGLISIFFGKTSSRYSVASKSMVIYNLKTIKSWDVIKTETSPRKLANYI
jgi:hypothetical protein